MKDETNHEAAMRLAVAIKRLQARLRDAASARSTGLPISQISILKHLRDNGPATAASLAAAEHVSQQAIAQSLTALKRAGLVQAKPDATDKRKIMISVTKAGEKLFTSAIASRNAWLSQAIDANIGARERPALDRAIELLERLADTGTPRDVT
jgi:DNA-binding MarR family transcriptional regulator